MEMTKGEVSTALRALESVIVDERTDNTQRTAIIKAVFTALLPGEPKLKNRRKESHASKQRTGKARARQAGSERR